MPPTASPSGPLHRGRINQVGAPSFDHFNFISSLWRVRLPYFDGSMVTVWSLSIFDCLVVSVKVSISYNRQVAIWPLKTCVQVLTVKDLVRSMSELCQCDPLLTLYIFLPFNPTLETSPLGKVTGPPKIVVAKLWPRISPVAITSHLASHLILTSVLDSWSLTLSDTSLPLELPQVLTSPVTVCCWRLYLINQFIPTRGKTCIR